MLLAAELLKKAQEMIKRQVHPSVIISGFKTACKQGINFVREHLALNVDELGPEGLAKVA